MNDASRAGRIERELDLLRWAERRDGLFTRADARAAGMSDHQIRERARSGRWVALAPGVWTVGGAAVTWRQQLRAGLLWLGEHAVVSGYAAGELLRFDDFEFQKVEFLVPRFLRGRAARPFDVHTTHTLRLIDRVTVDDLPCTSASRTILDLAARGTSATLLGKAIDSAMRHNQSSAHFLRKQLTQLRGPGRDGVRLLDELLEDSGGHTRLERQFLTLMRRNGLPAPDRQTVIRSGARFVARVDFSYEAHPLVVEVSGRKGHAYDTDRDRDAQRRNELQDLGLTVKEFTYGQVFKRPEYVVDQMRSTLRRLGARL